MSALPLAIGFTTIRHLRQLHLVLSTQQGRYQGVAVQRALSEIGGFRQMFEQEVQHMVQEALCKCSCCALLYICVYKFLSAALKSMIPASTVCCTIGGQGTCRGARSRENGNSLVVLSRLHTVDVLLTCPPCCGFAHLDTARSPQPYPLCRLETPPTQPPHPLHCAPQAHWFEQFLRRE